MNLLKAHWEAWDRCNLRCAFCYRMKERPLSTDQARQLITLLAQAGFRQFVFAGGDPSLRKDIGALIAHAKEKALQVEVQTNAHLFERVFLPVLEDVDLFGFSLDSEVAVEHDTLRGGPGNQERVLRAIATCEAAGRPYVVRTVCSAQNVEGALGVGALIANARSLRRWSFVEFSPVGDGYKNRSIFTLADGAFAAAAARARQRYPGLMIDVYPNQAKGGVYFLIKPNGDVYTTDLNFAGLEYAAVGNVLADGVAACLARLPVDATAHAQRYAPLL